MSVSDMDNFQPEIYRTNSIGRGKTNCCGFNVPLNFAEIHLIPSEDERFHPVLEV